MTSRQDVPGLRTRRVRGSRACRNALAEAVSADDIAQVAQKVVDAAKAGKPWAVRELLDRLLGKPHAQIELQADVDSVREYTERGREEAQRIARILLENPPDEA